ncbi:putative Recombinase Rad51 [Leptomonas seymouri]|uniref:DNA repair protein RAD51 homolog 3 n=1 Tax=Leptomonas seymouri TaxID=5684 RepID=A0A0N1PE01_LEPSE|nr:putative Recombinase Rad51 [Leptomonas seymouri]|eukprot:KPI89848.1 putative Recombinase Rad51 [Leptomonas seymouri]
MATIECCEFLSNSTKAKLQDAGILYLADLTRLLNFDDNLEEPPPRAQMIDNLKRRVTQRASLHARNAEALPSSGGVICAAPDCTAETHAIAITPIDDVSFFTNEEVDEVFEAVCKVSEYSGDPLRMPGGPEDKDVSSTSADGPSCPSCAFGGADESAATHQAASRIPGCRSLREILTEAKERQLRGQPTHATTFSRELDTLLGGGVPVGGVTEVSGPPGVGKTQLLMQLAVSCASPVEFGGLGGTCLFVDTEGSFVVERLEQMATAAVSLVKRILARDAARHTLHQAARSGDARSERVSRHHCQTLPEELARKRTRSSSRSATARVAHVDLAAPASTSAVVKDAEQLTGKSPRRAPTDGDSSDHVLRSAAETSFLMGNPYPLSNDFTVESVLERVRYVRVTELTELLAFLYSLPLWLDQERTGAVGNDPAAALSSASSTTLGEGEGAPLRMVLIDSIALPFRASDAFEKNASTCADACDSISNGSVSSFSGATGAPHGALSKHGLWQRSRLLYQCSTTLEHLASSYQLSVVVSNHMTTKLLRTLSSGGRASRDSDGSAGPAWQTVLVPALGDAWRHALSTRLLLAFHHYELPSCAFTSDIADAPPGDDKGCQEDIVYSRMATAVPSTAPSPVDRVVQHRVARLLKASGRPRWETCFLITSKGVRDVRKGMVEGWSAQLSTAAD